MLQCSKINFNFNTATFAEQGQEWWVGGAARVWPQWERGGIERGPRSQQRQWGRWWVQGFIRILANLVLGNTISLMLNSWQLDLLQFETISQPSPAVSISRREGDHLSLLARTQQEVPPSSSASSSRSNTLHILLIHAHLLLVQFLLHAHLLLVQFLPHAHLLLVHLHFQAHHLLLHLIFQVEHLVPARPANHLEHFEDVFEEIEGGGKAGMGRKTPGKAR